MIGSNDELAGVVACVAVITVFYVAAEYALGKVGEWMLTRDSTKNTTHENSK
jgi:hypothetical protein